MTCNPQTKLSWSEKLTRLTKRLQEPEWRRYAKLLVAGKAVGLVLVIMVAGVVSGLFFPRVYAADAEVKAADVVNPLNTVWTLVAAFLVLASLNEKRLRFLWLGGAILILVLDLGFILAKLLLGF